MRIKTRTKNFKTWVSYFIYNKITKKVCERNYIVYKNEKIESEAIFYTIKNVNQIMNFLVDNYSIENIKGKTILEIGPGQDIGILLVLLGLGAKKVYVVDRFFFGWNDEIHINYYKQLLRSSEEAFPNYSFDVLKEVILNKSYNLKEIEIINSSLEDIDNVPSEIIDISFSNACFEHLHDSQKAITSLSRITKKDGVGFHQIDMRDHRNFEKPLEFLSMSNFLFKKIAALSYYDFGNRIRHYEFQHFFEKNQFQCKFQPNMFTNDDYLKDVTKRLSKKYKEISPSELAIISGRFLIKKGCFPKT